MTPKTVIAQRITFKNTYNKHVGNYFFNSSKQQLHLSTIEFLNKLGCFGKQLKL